MRLLLWLLLLSAFLPARAQERDGHLELGISANAYKGDLSRSYEKWSSAFHAGYRVTPRNRINGHINLSIGAVSGQNLQYQFVDELGNAATPNLFFNSRFFSLNFDLQYALVKRKNFVLYLSQGLGFMKFNPKDENNGSLKEAANTRPGDESYATSALMLPTQAGVIYTLPNRFAFGFQAGFANVQTDYLDNISQWGKSDKNDNVLVYKFTFYVPMKVRLGKKGEKVPVPVPVDTTIIASAAPPPVPVPDRDQDGVADSADRCPGLPGIALNEGCPAVEDKDGDGMSDLLDQCPDVPGPAASSGCPLTDADADSVYDYLDDCPGVPGVPENKGCPAVSVEDETIINHVRETLVFETGNANILPVSYPALDEFSHLLLNMKDAEITIEGHTDNIGNPEANMRLSTDRAQAVKNYLIRKGVKESQISIKGFGDQAPVSSNDTEEGRALNRRVDIILRHK